MIAPRATPITTAMSVDRPAAAWPIVSPARKRGCCATAQPAMIAAMASAAETRAAPKRLPDLEVEEAGLDEADHGEAPSGPEPGKERRSVVAHDNETRERKRSGENRGPQGTRPKVELQHPLAEAAGVGGEVHRGQVTGGGDRQRADQDGG